MNSSLFRGIAESKWFNNSILAVILLAGILVGVQTYIKHDSPFFSTLEMIDLLILLIFTVEIFIKMLAHGDQPWLYFKDPWNVFDFIIVAVCWLAHVMPQIDAGFVAVIRLARVLRVLRLVQAMPQLKMLVDSMLKSIPSMGYVGVMLFLLFYIYGAMGVFLFSKNDPLYFGSLHNAMLSLFQISTLEGWGDIMKLNIYGCNHPNFGYAENGCLNPEGHGWVAVIYFVSFVLLGTMIVLNLFIGVIMNSMDEVRADQELEAKKLRLEKDSHTVEDEIKGIQEMMEGMKKQLDFLAYRLK